MVADPKALQYILHTSGYNFPKSQDASHVIRMLTGDGVGCTHGKLCHELGRTRNLNKMRLRRRNPSASEEGHGCRVFGTPFEGVSHTIPSDFVKGKSPLVKIRMNEEVLTFFRF
jgi:hypothetical protein